MGRYIDRSHVVVSVESIGIVTDAMVSGAEKALGLSFDSKIKTYLKNPISTDGELEYVGLLGKGYTNTVTATLSFRTNAGEGAPPFPNDGIVLGHVGNGDCYFWSLSEQRVGYYYHDNPTVEFSNKPWAKSLDAFADQFFK